MSFAHWAKAFLIRAAGMPRQAGEKARRCIGLFRNRHKQHSANDAIIGSILNAAPTAIFLVRPDRTIITTNECMIQMLGYSSEEIIGYNACKFYADEIEYHRVGAALYTQEAPLGPASVEARFRHKDGSGITGIVSISPLDPANPPAGVVCAILDITRRKQAEEALRAGESRLRGITANSVDIIVLTDESGAIIEWNPRAASITGIASEEALGQTLSDLMTRVIPLETRKGAPAAYFKKRVDWSLRKGRWPREFGENANGIPIQSRNGAIRYVQHSASFITTAQGKMLILLIAHDVTERRQAEEDLRDSEAFFRSQFEYGNIGIAITSASMRWLRVNLRLRAMLGYSEEEFAAKTWLDMTHPDDLRSSREQFARLANGDYDAFEIDRRFIRKDGGVVFTHTTASCHRNPDGSLRHVFTTVLDISAEKEAETQRANDLAEIERFNRLAIGRERRMIELKNNVNELSLLLGRPEPYAITESVDNRDTVFAGPMHTAEEMPDPRLEELIGKGKFQGLIDSYCQALGIAASILDLEGNVLIHSHEQPLCAIFHKTCDDTLQRCVINDTKLATNICDGSKFSIYQCLNGLIEAASPIVVEGRHIGNVFVGQFFLDPPSEEYFLSQADEFGFPVDEYLAAVRQVPIIEKDKLPAIVSFLTHFASLAGSLGIERYRGRWNEAWLAAGYRELRLEREAALNLAEDAQEARLAVENSRQALMDSETRLRGVFMAVPLALVVLGPDRSLVDLNEGMSAMFCYSREELLGQNTRMLYFTEAEYTDVGRELYGAPGQAKATTIEIRMRRKDGAALHTLLSASALDLEHPEAGAVVAVLDITSRKMLELQLRQSQKMEAIGQLAGGVAHDFNNMLQAILGYTSLALRSLDTSSELHPMLSEVYKAGERAASLTRQLLAFSRWQVLQLQPIDLNTTIVDLMRMLRRLIGESIELSISPEPNLLCANADRGQIEQVLMNLCINARDAMPEGGKLLIETGNINFDDAFVQRHDWAKPGRHVMISVSDTGLGMDQDTQRRIFDPFYTTKDPGKGTGLGLSTVYGIVRQHEGMIQVYSEPKLGSRFIIYLPAIEASPTVLTMPSLDPAAGGDETILVAEDEEQIRELARRILTSAGYNVFTAANGEEALALYREHGASTDLLLLDVVMPKMGGRKACDAIRSINPDARCLFTSGYSENAVDTNFVLQPSLHFLQKPYGHQQLLRAVRQALDTPQ